jgi:hypothetical protein
MPTSSPIQEGFEDAACLRILRKAKAVTAKSANVSLNDVKARLGRTKA